MPWYEYNLRHTGTIHELSSTTVFLKGVVPQYVPGTVVKKCSLSTCRPISLYFVRHDYYSLYSPITCDSSELLLQYALVRVRDNISYILHYHKIRYTEILHPYPEIGGLIHLVISYPVEIFHTLYKYNSW